MLRWRLRFPHLVQIETVTACNARCIMCPTPTMERKKGFITEALYRKIIDECALYRRALRSLGLYLSGEPLLDKQLPERVKYAHDKRLRDVYISTNAQLMTAEKSARLIDAGLDRLYVSLDGTTKETYEKVRVGLNFDTVVRNVDEFLRLRRERKSRVKVEMQIIRLDETAHEVEPFVERWKDQADRVVVKDGHNWAEQSDNRPHSRLTHPTARKPCPQLWYNLNVFDNGDVPLCCYDYEGKVILGNVERQALREVWRGKELQRIRAAHLRLDFSEMPLCDACINTWYIGDEPVWWFEPGEIKAVPKTAGAAAPAIGVLLPPPKPAAEPAGAASPRP
jgi:MoaA/NifB/PqqE/SkfB family radical SAM enzyme